MPNEPTPEGKPSTILSKGQKVTVLSCKAIKAAIAKEIRTAVKDRAVATRLINSLGSEVAYGTGGGGGGVGVA
jgi:hypothetical protein